MGTHYYGGRLVYLHWEQVARVRQEQSISVRFPSLPLSTEPRFHRPHLLPPVGTPDPWGGMRTLARTAPPLLLQSDH